MVLMIIIIIIIVIIIIIIIVIKVHWILAFRTRQVYKTNLEMTDSNIKIKQLKHIVCDTA